MKKIIIGMALFLCFFVSFGFALYDIIIIDVEDKCDYGCLVPIGLENETPITPNPGSETTLQDVLDTLNVTVHAVINQSGIEQWHTDQATTLEITFLARFAAFRQAFGYYLNGDSSTFTGIFEAGNNPNYSLPVASPGDKFIVHIPEGRIIGFAIDSYRPGPGTSVMFHTQDILNPLSIKQALVFDLCNRYIIGFEDRTGGDYDYQDAIVDIRVINCTGFPNCEEPEIFVDPTARIWEPNDETWYTADIYGDEIINRHYVSGYVNPKRGNYIFTGETLRYFTIVEDILGDKDNIFGAAIQVDDTYVGGCAEPVIPFNDFSAFGPSFPGWNPDSMKQYICKLIVTDAMNGDGLVELSGLTGGEDTNCDGNAESEFDAGEMNFNPDYDIDVDGTVNFGVVVPGSVASSTDPVTLENDGDVLMDTYIAASDYFTDPLNGMALCGDGNGIPYHAFSYYAMKGSVNSGVNDNLFPGLGETRGDREIPNGICEADVDEYTTLPSHSERIDDMCRIINWDEDASILWPGDTMNLLFQLDVPDPCDGNFENGRFYFVGEVV